MFYLFGRLQVDTDLQLIFGAGRAETPLPVAHGTTTGRSHQHQHAHSAYPCKNRCVWITCVNICFVALILHSTMIWICMYTVYVYLYLYLYLVISSFPAFHMWAVNHSMYRDHHPATSWPEEVQRGLLWHPWCQPGKRSVVTGPGTVIGWGQSIGWSSLPDQVVNSLALVLVEIPTTVNPTLVAELRLLRGFVVTLLKRRDDSGDRRDLEDSCD